MKNVQYILGIIAAGLMITYMITENFALQLLASVILSVLCAWLGIEQLKVKRNLKYSYTALTLGMLLFVLVLLNVFSFS